MSGKRHTWNVQSRGRAVSGKYQYVFLVRNTDTVTSKINVQNIYRVHHKTEILRRPRAILATKQSVKSTLDSAAVHQHLILLMDEGDGEDTHAVPSGRAAHELGSHRGRLPTTIRGRAWVKASV